MFKTLFQEYIRSYPTFLNFPAVTCYNGKASLLYRYLLYAKYRALLRQSLKKIGFKSHHSGPNAKPVACIYTIDASIFGHFSPKPPLLLKPASTLTGFKKLMYNSVKVSLMQYVLTAYRRKHGHSHYNQILKENTRLSRYYAYLSKAVMQNYTAFTLNSQAELEDDQRSTANISTPYSIPRSTRPPHYLEGDRRSIFPSCRKERKPVISNNNGPVRPIPKMAHFLESRTEVILGRNLYSLGIKSAQQRIRKGVYLNGGLERKASLPTFPGDVLLLK